MLYIIEVMENPFDEVGFSQKYYVRNYKNGVVKSCLSSDSAKSYSFIEATNECAVLNKVSQKFYRPVPHNIIIQSKLNDLD
jgi:hypothetical protein